ncbi:F-box protein-like protein [Salvia divinorum]|uniref:F-box protein-like protein n=1 Tax=Salvia divinorum TaxID=28513 RepID=A0ABD1HLN0_SALDI
MNQDLFRYLPSELFTDILLRLPLENIASCKRVCKPWLGLIESDAFLKFHLSKSAPALAVSMPTRDSNWFNLFRLGDEREHKHKQDPIIKFNFPQASTIQGSANGLLLLKNPFIDCLYVCNPITREFVELHGRLTGRFCMGDCYGFGVSKISGQHKVVYLNPKYNEFHVYTLETGSSWRSIESASLSFRRCFSSVGALVNGNLYWLVSNDTQNPYICCFDLETEGFSTFSAPVKSNVGMLYTLGGCLCFSDDDPFNGDNVIWLLKETEPIEKCWCEVRHVTKDGPYLDIFVEDYYYGQDFYKRLQPIKIYRNGDMLTLWDESIFLYYSKRRSTLKKIDLFGKMDDDCYYINSVLLTPSFLSLKRNLGMKNVRSF